MLEFLKNLFASEPFIPHGHCYLWKSELVWLHIMSDFFIALAYYSIPITLVYFVRKRQDLPFDWIFLLFGIFIIACGTTHLMEIWTLWYPTYWLAGFVKSVTALASVYTALELVPLVPKALALPSPAQLEATNQELLEQISKRKLAEEALQIANKKLELRVEERTTELRNTNQRLQSEIVERRQVESALRNALQKLSFHVENSPLAVVEWNHEFRLRHWSQKSEQMFGWKSEEVFGRLWQEWQFVFEEDLETVSSQIAGLVDGSTPSLVSYNRNYTKDGSVIDCEWYNSSLLDEFGNLVSVLSLVQDISDRKRTEQALAESHSILHSVIEGTTDSIFMKDLQGRYVTINSAGAKVIGKPVEEIIGKDDLEIFPSYIALPIMQNDRKLIAAEADQTYEDIVPVIGELRTFLSTKTICRNKQGNVIGVIGIARDITERKVAEQQIKELNQDLERRVVERTAQLKAANKELEAFSYSVSHDLRTPLRSIDGFSQVLLERYAEQLDDKGKHYLQRVRAGSQRLGELIDDLLKLSRVTRAEMQCQMVDLTAMIEAIAADLQHTQPERQVDFVIAPEVFAQSDCRLLRVALENLLHNAWKFTSKQLQPRIEFGTLPQRDGITAYFIRDNGAGFDMTYANKLFGAFQRLHTTEEFPGTGVGLATVQRIIHRHGGKIWAEGAVEQGATFYFSL